MSEIIRLDSVITINGFFHTYNATHNTHFVELFGTMDDTDITKIDCLLSDIYGDLPLAYKYANMETGAINRIVDNCDLLFFETWKRYKSAIAGGIVKDYDTPYAEKSVIGETRGNTTDAVNTVTNKNQVYAFDDVANASNDSENVSSGTNNVTENHTTERTDTINRSGTMLPTDVAKSQIDFSKNEVFLDLIFADIIETICVCIV